MNQFYNNRCNDQPFGAIERMLKANPNLIGCPEYNTGDLVNVRSCKHLKVALHGLLGQIENIHAMSGVYTIRLCRDQIAVVLSKYELRLAMNL